MAGCCWSPPYVKLQSTAISLFIFCLIGNLQSLLNGVGLCFLITKYSAISLSITNFLLQNNRNDCGYCYWEYGYGKNSTNRVGVKMDHEPSDRYLDSIGPETRTMWYEVGKLCFSVWLRFLLRVKTTTTTPPPTTTGSTTEAADTGVFNTSAFVLRQYTQKFQNSPQTGGIRQLHIGNQQLEDIIGTVKVASVTVFPFLS